MMRNDEFPPRILPICWFIKSQIHINDADDDDNGNDGDGTSSCAVSQSLKGYTH